MASNEIVDDGGIFDGARTFSGVNLSPVSYEGEIQDISILSRRGAGEPLAKEEKFAPRSELGGN